MRTVLAAAAAAVVALGAEARAQSIDLVPVASGFTNVTDIANAGDDRLFIVEQAGRIRIVADGVVRPVPFLDISFLVTAGGERGLLGLAFHPDYASNGFFYVNYIDAAGDTVIARFTRSANPDVAVPSSRRVILTQDQPTGFGNHKGGDLAFGPADGFLYVALGDGGSGCDPFDLAQGGETFLGKILRIDVDGGAPYAIPPDNPFLGSGDVVPEIWSLGLRNPWRISFDRRPPHDLYIGDVGQNEWEEIGFQAGNSGGGENYGWDCFEGTHAGTCPTTAVCPPEGNVFPIHEYSHDEGCSVTGGFVYRGRRSPALVGRYFFADFCSKHLWSLVRRNGRWDSTDYGAILPFGPRTFGEDVDGELYVATSSTVFRIEDPDAAPADECPAEPSVCRSPDRAVLLLNDAPPAGASAADRVIFRYLQGPEEAPGAFGDPTEATDVRLCVYAGAPAALVLEAVAPGGGTCDGAPCWVPIAGAGHRFVDASASEDGLTRVVLRPLSLPSDTGSRIIVKGAGPGLALPELPLASAAAVAQVHRSGDDACWGARFEPAEVVRNDGIAFRAIHLD
jgi:glucose/arabinose dehydrogenase